jgi:hypothetical protein
MRKDQIPLINTRPGDKTISTLIEWLLPGRGLTITRRVMGDGPNCLKRSIRIKWMVSDEKGQTIYVPNHVHKHEQSIAKWILAGRP